MLAVAVVAEAVVDTDGVEAFVSRELWNAFYCCLGLESRCRREPLDSLKSSSERRKSGLGLGVQEESFALRTKSHK